MIDFAPGILPLIAIILGGIGYSRGDKYGIYGLTIGIITTVLAVIVTILVYIDLI